MIRYDLVCDNAHAFDGWFSDSTAFDVQASSGLVACPVCGSAKVTKQLMAPQLPAKANARGEEKRLLFAAPENPKQRELLDAMRKLRAHVESTAENVGDQFAKEARRIHYNEAEARGIFGEATIEDAKALIEEGVEVSPLPNLPEDAN